MYVHFDVYVHVSVKLYVHVCAYVYVCLCMCVCISSLFPGLGEYVCVNSRLIWASFCIKLGT